MFEEVADLDGHILWRILRKIKNRGKMLFEFVALRFLLNSRVQMRFDQRREIIKIAT